MAYGLNTHTDIPLSLRRGHIKPEDWNNLSWVEIEKEDKIKQKKKDLENILKSKI